MSINGKTSINLVKEATRKRDKEIIFKEYVKDKLMHNSELIDIEARISFKSKDATPSVIKHANRCNYCGVRDTMMNRKLTEIECQRHNKDKNWDHLTKFRATRQCQR